MNSGRADHLSPSVETFFPGNREGGVPTSGENTSRRESMVLKNERGTGISPFLWGLSAGAALLAVYFGILTLSNPLVHAIEELRQIGW